MTYKAFIFGFGLSVSVLLSGCETPYWMSDNEAPVTEAEHRQVSIVPLVPEEEQMSPYALPGDKFYPQIPEERPATGSKVLVVDLNIPAWAAYDAEGHLVKEGQASGGRSFCPDIQQGCKTVVGTFKVFRKQGADCKSSRFPIETHGGAPMPYCMHFYGGYALHGSYSLPGYNASHGCVRLLPSSAKWLNENFVQIGTTVIVEPYTNKPEPGQKV